MKNMIFYFFIIADRSSPKVKRKKIPFLTYRRTPHAEQMHAARRADARQPQNKRTAHRVQQETIQHFDPTFNLSKYKNASYFYSWPINV